MARRQWCGNGGIQPEVAEGFMSPQSHVFSTSAFLQPSRGDASCIMLLAPVHSPLLATAHVSLVLQRSQPVGEDILATLQTCVRLAQGSTEKRNQKLDPEQVVIAQSTPRLRPKCCLKTGKLPGILLPTSSLVTSAFSFHPVLFSLAHALHQSAISATLFFRPPSADGHKS